MVGFFWTAYLLLGNWLFHTISLVASFTGLKLSLSSRFSIWPLLDIPLNSGLYARTVYILALLYIINANFNLYLTSVSLDTYFTPYKYSCQTRGERRLSLWMLYQHNHVLIIKSKWPLWNFIIAFIPIQNFANQSLTKILLPLLQ